MATFSETFTRMRDEFDQSHEHRQQLLRDLVDEVKTHAAQTASQLAEQARNRRADFNAQMGNLRARVRDQRNQTRGWLAEVLADLRQGGELFHGRGSRRAAKGRR